MATYRLENQSRGQAPRINKKGERLPPGKSRSFDSPTPQILRGIRRGVLKAVHVETGAEERFEEWEIVSYQIPLDPDEKKGLPPSLQGPRKGERVVPPSQKSDLLTEHVPSGVLRSILGNEYGLFRLAELQSHVRPITIAGRGFADATGLGQAQHTEGLHLRGNGIETLGNLAGMKRLRALDVSENNLTRIFGLPYVETLEHIDLRGNSVSVIGPVSALDRLSYLDLRGNSLNGNAVSNLIEDLWENRYDLAGRNTVVRLEGCASPSEKDLERVNGNGAFDNEGLIQMGMVITYDAPSS